VCHPSTQGKRRSALAADLSPLAGLRLDEITSDNPAPLLVNAPILRAMPKLKTINGQPVARFFEKAVRKEK
jgi:hypothetical protein